MGWQRRDDRSRDLILNPAGQRHDFRNEGLTDAQFMMIVGTPKPEDVEFKGCPADEEAQCVTLECDTLPKGESQSLIFRGTVEAKEDVCNPVVVTATPADPACNVESITKKGAHVILVTECNGGRCGPLLVDFVPPEKGAP